MWKLKDSNLPDTVCFRDCEERFAQNDHLVFLGKFLIFIVCFKIRANPSHHTVQFPLSADKSAVLSAMQNVAGCKAELISGEFYPSGFGIAMPLGSPYKPFFDKTWANYANM